MAKTALNVDTDALTQRITRSPFAGSHKVYLPGSRADVRVPFREITLSDTLIHDGAGELRLRDAALGVGMRTLRADGARWVTEGATSLAELVRVTRDQ